MADYVERIPIPPGQRRELFRERVLPVLCFIATLVACVWLWGRQLAATPYAIGEVQGDSADVRSPCDGAVLAIEGEGAGALTLFAQLQEGDVAARVKPADGVDAVEVLAPLSGAIASVIAHPGQFVREGDPLLKISATEPSFIVCRLPSEGRQRAKTGGKVAVRQLGLGTGWRPSVIEAVGPAALLAPALEGGDVNMVTRTLPIKIALPEGLELRPGSLVEVRLLSEATPL